MTSSAEDVFKNKITKADAGHYYIHVFKKDGAIKTSHIKLSGYKQMFEKNPQFMYVYSLRHAGVETDLVEYLTKSGFTNSDELRTLLRDSYTSLNASMMTNQIETEIAHIPVTKKDDKKKSVSLQYIISLKEVLDNTKSQVKRAAVDDAPAAPSTPKTRSKADLDSRLDDLPEDKVLDITHYDPITDIGIKTAKRTVKGSRRPLAAAGKMSRIVCDFSKKGADNAEKALVSLGMTKDAARNAVSAAQSSKTASLSRIAISPRK
jgi:ribosomal protein L7/L12